MIRLDAVRKASLTGCSVSSAIEVDESDAVSEQRAEDEEVRYWAKVEARGVAPLVETGGRGKGTGPETDLSGDLKLMP